MAVRQEKEPLVAMTMTTLGRTHHQKCRGKEASKCRLKMLKSLIVALF